MHISALRRRATLALLLLAGLSAVVCLSALSISPAFAAEPAPSVTASSVVDPQPVVRFEDDNLGVSYSGAWESRWMQNASGASYRLSTKAGSTVTAVFDGSGVALIGRTGPDRGLVRIVLDDRIVANVDCYSAVRSGQSVLWSESGLPPGRHVVKLLVLGEMRGDSTGTGVIFDAFEVNGSPVATPALGTGIADGSSKLAKAGRWWVSKRAGAVGGRGWRTSSKGATVSMRFRGTGVTWFGRKDAESGLADVFMDGRRIATVSAYRPLTAEGAVLYSVSGLPNATHALTIRARGKAGLGGGRKVDVDGFLVQGSVLQGYAPSPFRYKWKSHIVIDKSEFRLYWIRNGQVIKTYPVALGRLGMTTPSQVWRVGTKYKTDPRGVYGPRKLRLFKRVRSASGYRYVFTRYGIHGTNQQWVIGTRASHGCIRMYNKDVRELWSRVPVGTMVVTRD